MKISSNLSGIAGTYYVAAALSQQGYIAMVTMKNTRGIDIVVTSDNCNSVGIQVKTNQDDRRKGWILSKKDETNEADNLLYCFVNLKKESLPDIYIVPSRIVAKTVREEYQQWLKTPGKKGQQRNDNSLRMFFDTNELYKNKWKMVEDILKS